MRDFPRHTRRSTCSARSAKKRRPSRQYRGGGGLSAATSPAGDTPALDTAPALGAAAWTDLGRVLAAPTRRRVAHDVFGVDRGRHVLVTPDRPIGLDGDASGSGPRVDQFERDVRTGI